MSNHEVIWSYLPTIFLLFDFCGLGCCRLDREKGQKEKTMTFVAYYRRNLSNWYVVDKTQLLKKTTSKLGM